MTLILCSCGRYFVKRMIMGGKDVKMYRCPHCGKDFWENKTTRELTKRINGEWEEENW